MLSYNHRAPAGISPFMHVAEKAINGFTNATSTAKSDRLDIGFTARVSYQVCGWGSAFHLINLPMRSLAEQACYVEKWSIWKPFGNSAPLHESFSDKRNLCRIPKRRQLKWGCEMSTLSALLYIWSVGRAQLDTLPNHSLLCLNGRGCSSIKGNKTT